MRNAFVGTIANELGRCAIGDALLAPAQREPVGARASVALAFFRRIQKAQIRTKSVQNSTRIRIEAFFGLWLSERM